MAMTDQLRASGLLDESATAEFCRDGHFVYESGDHGDLWLALDLLYTNPRRLQRAAARLAAQLRPHAPDVICGPLLGGALTGQWVAHELNLTFVYAEPRTGGGYAIPQRLRPLLAGKRVAIIDDAINAGAATLPCVRDVEASGGTVAAVGCLLVRKGGLPMWATLGIEVEYLAGLEWNTWPVVDCPLCRSGVPLELSS